MDIVARLRGASVLQVHIPVSVLRLVAFASFAASRLGGYAPMLTAGKVRELTHQDWVCDNAAITRQLGWSPRVQLEEGLKSTLDWQTVPTG